MFLNVIERIRNFIFKRNIEDAQDFLKLEYSKLRPQGEYVNEDELINRRAS